MNLILSPWFWLALAVAAAGFATNGWIDEKAAFDSFKGGVAALGKQAEERRTLIIERDKARQEATNATNKKLRSDNRNLVERLRDSNPSGGGLPAAPTGSRRPDLVCFDRAEYQRADGAFVAGARGLADEGTASTIDLNSAKQWANQSKEK